MNKVILIGRLTRDPELRTIANGTPTATFSLAVDRNFTNQQGEREADFINCVVWRKQTRKRLKTWRGGKRKGRERLESDFKSIPPRKDARAIL